MKLDQRYQRLLERIREMLDQGTVPWRKTWAAQGPRNRITKKAYKGINFLLLASLPSKSPYWVTFRQAKRLGGHVRQGEHGVPIVFWKPYKILDKETEEEKTIPLLRHYTVYNLSQCEHVAEPKKDPEPEPIPPAKSIVKGYRNAPDINQNGIKPRYFPNQDIVECPGQSTFEDAPSYYSTLFHELVHSTGHETRLGRLRKDPGGELACFGSEPYAEEELVAELGASFLRAACQIPDTRVLENSAAYIASWKQRLNGDPGVLIRAAQKAQKAVYWIRGETPQGTEKTKGGTDETLHRPRVLCVRYRWPK